MTITTTPRPIAARPLTGPEAVALVTGAIRVEVAPPLGPVPVRGAKNNTAGGAGEAGK